MARGVINFSSKKAPLGHFKKNTGTDPYFVTSRYRSIEEGLDILAHVLESLWRQRCIACTP